VKVYLCEDKRGRFITADRQLIHWDHVLLVSYEYDDPGELEAIEWVYYVLEDMGVEMSWIPLRMALMWLVDNYPEAARQPFREIRRKFYEPILKCEAALSKSAADRIDQGGI
jgi:hypothetical protein